MQRFSDEQLLDLYLENGNYLKTAGQLGVSKQAIENRLGRMRGSGVNIPFTNLFRKRTYTPERVKELNAYIKRKTQETDTRKV